MHFLYFILIFLGFIMARPMNSFTGIDAIKSLPVLLCLVGLLKFAFFQKGRIFLGRIITKIDVLIYFGFVFVYFSSVLRRPGVTDSVVGMVNETGQILLISFLTFCFVNYSLRSGKDFADKVSKTAFALIAAPAVFIVINILSYFLGIEIANEDSMAAGEEPPSVMASLIGLNFIRNSLLFGIHPNNTAVAVGGILLCNIFGLKFLTLVKWQKVFLITSLCCGVLFLLMLDSRGSAGSLLIVTMLVLTLERARMLGIIKRLILVLPLLPFFILSALALVSSSELGKSLAREENDDDLNTGNGRSVIWEHCIDAILDPELEHFWGYGQAGHITSGVSKKWSWKFPNYVAHNFFFQSFFDIGYLGIIFFITVLYISVSSAIFLYNRGIKPAIIFIAFALYYPLSGMFESTFGIYNHIYTTIIITYSLCPILFKNAYLVQRYLANKTKKEEKQVLAEVVS